MRFEEGPAQPEIPPPPSRLALIRPGQEVPLAFGSRDGAGAPLSANLDLDDTEVDYLFSIFELRSSTWEETDILASGAWPFDEFGRSSGPSLEASGVAISFELSDRLVWIATFVRVGARTGGLLMLRDGEPDSVRELEASESVVVIVDVLDRRPSVMALVRRDGLLEVDRASEVALIDL